MNDKILYSSKRAKRSAHQLITMIFVIGVIVILCIGSYMVLVKACGLFDEDFFHLSILTMLHRIFNLFTIILYLFTFIWAKILIIPFIYDVFGTEMIFISDDILTINRHALFLHKTKTIKVSDIVEIEYHPIETSPYVNYTCQNDYNVVITYYKKYTRRKWFFICGLNFTEEEFVKFASTLKK